MLRLYPWGPDVLHRTQIFVCRQLDGCTRWSRGRQLSDIFRPVMTYPHVSRARSRRLRMSMHTDGTYCRRSTCTQVRERLLLTFTSRLWCMCVRRIILSVVWSEPYIAWAIMGMLRIKIKFTIYLGRGGATSCLQHQSFCGPGRHITHTHTQSSPPVPITFSAEPAAVAGPQRPASGEGRS